MSCLITDIKKYIMEAIPHISTSIPILRHGYTAAACSFRSQQGPKPKLNAYWWFEGVPPYGIFYPCSLVFIVRTGPVFRHAKVTELAVYLAKSSSEIHSTHLECKSQRMVLGMISD